MIDLEKLGYKQWQKDDNDFGYTLKFQKRMDSTEKYKDFPLCCTNDKIFMNIDYSTMNFDGTSHISYTFSMVHESNEIWSDLKFYGLSEDTVEKYGVEEFADRLMELWKHNYFLHYQI